MGLFTGACLALFLTSSHAQTAPLIPKDVLFAHGERMMLRLSPDGKQLAWVAPSLVAPGQLGIYRADINDLQNVKPVLQDGNRRFPRFFWSPDSSQIFFLRDIGGNENTQLYVVDIKTGDIEDLTANPNVQVHWIGARPNQPNKIYVSSNERDPAYFDIFSYNLVTHRMQREYLNADRFLEFLLDDDGRPGLAYRYDEAGNMDYFIYRDDKWELLFKFPLEDASASRLVTVNWRNRTLDFTDTRAGDKAELKRMNLRTQDVITLAAAKNADYLADKILTNHAGDELLAIGFDYLKPEYKPLDLNIGREIKQIQRLSRGHFSVVSSTVDDKQWLLAFNSDTSSIRYYLWNRQTRTGKLIQVMNPVLDSYPLAAMNPLVIPSRDGLELVSYLTYPVGTQFDPVTLKPSQPLPMVLLVHGGPWTRDSWGFDPEHQWLANRGFAVLSVNYRGSSGFGKKFTAASFGEWGGKMHDDLIDAVQFTVDHGMAIKNKVGIMGASYGGYAALLGAAFTPDTFAAAIDIVGVANLITSEQSIPDYWKPFRTNQIHRMGADSTTPEGRDYLWGRSPLSRADQIRIPLLVGHGDNDMRVKIAEAEQVVLTMLGKQKPVTFVRFPDEGHGFARPVNNQSFKSICENFLMAHLQAGRAEPLKLLPSTTMRVPVGAEHIPGLKEELNKL